MRPAAKCHGALPKVVSRHRVVVALQVGGELRDRNRIEVAVWKNLLEGSELRFVGPFALLTGLFLGGDERLDGISDFDRRKFGGVARGPRFRGGDQVAAGDVPSLPPFFKCREERNAGAKLTRRDEVVSVAARHFRDFRLPVG